MANSRMPKMKIVVTGSSSGIGRALAERLLEHGHEVWGLARRPQNELADKFPGHFGWSCCDLVEWPEVEREAGKLLKTWPAFDGVACCAGSQGAIGPALDADPQDWSATVRSNLDATYFALRALAPGFRAAPRRAKIICLSGGGATKARPRFSAYGAAKTGIVRLVETLAEEEKGAALDINALAPGAIATAMTDEIISAGPELAGQAEYRSALKTKAAGASPLQQALDCAEWLLSPASDGISGRLISAQWDPWKTLGSQPADIADSEAYLLRRVIPRVPDGRA